MAGEITQQLRANTALPKDSSSNPNTHFRWPSTFYFNFKGSDALFPPPLALYSNGQIKKHINIHIIKSKI